MLFWAEILAYTDMWFDTAQLLFSFIIQALRQSVLNFLIWHFPPAGLLCFDTSNFYFFKMAKQLTWHYNIMISFISALKNI